jgi:hypothetical protein
MDVPSPHHGQGSFVEQGDVGGNADAKGAARFVLAPARACGHPFDEIESQERFSAP